MDIQKELEVVGSYPSFFGAAGGTPKYNQPISALENIRKACKRGADGKLSGEQLWSPLGGDVLTFCPMHYPDNIARGFVIEKAVLNNDKDAGGLDMFGVEWEWVPAVQGSMARPGTEIFEKDPEQFLEWEKHIKMPDVDSWDWQGAADRNNEFLAAGERSVMPWMFTGFFERLISLLNFQHAAVAMIDEDFEDAIHRFFDACVGIYKKMLDNWKKYFGATMVYFHDDWGSQQKSFLKPDTYEEMIVPHLKDVCDYAHSIGVFVNFHSCGKIENLVPLMVKANVDCWSGQAMNDRLEVLKANHGKIYVEFGPDVGGFGMPPASDEETRTKVNEWLDTFGDYIDSIFVNTSFGGSPIAYKTIYEYSRKKFAK